MKTSLFLISLATAALTLTGCDPSAQAPTPSGEAAGAPLIVTASNTPLAYFASRIGGEFVTSSYPGPADEDPAFWVPNDDAVTQMQSADLIILNGATYEKWLPQVTLPEAKLLDSSAAFKAEFLDSGEATTHSHGPGGDHSHEGTAFTTWIDFQQAKAQARAIHDTLVKRLPHAQADLARNTDTLLSDLDQLDQRMSTVAKRIGDQPLVASHPVYQYWARRYHLNVKALLWEPEVVPDESQMEDLRALLKTHPARWMIWEGDPAPASVEALEPLGLKSLVFDPCGGPAEQGDWLSVMQANLNALEAAFPQP